MFIETQDFVWPGAFMFAIGACGGSTTPSSSTPEGPSKQPPAFSHSAAAAGSEPSGSSGAAVTRSGGDSPLLIQTRGRLSDPQIAAITERANLGEVEQARLAQARAQDEHVRAFAALMIEQHGQARKRQAELTLGEVESPLAQQLMLEAHSAMETLKAKQTTDFDRAYIQTQIEAHQKLLGAIQNDLRPSAERPELRQYLDELAPQVSLHLAQATSIQQQLQTGGETPGGSRKTSSR
jgi:putative membrane protein